MLFLLGFSVRSCVRATAGIGEFCRGVANGAPGSDLVQSLLVSVRAFAMSGYSQLVLSLEAWNEHLESSRGVCFGARDSELSSPLGCGFDSSASFSRQIFTVLCQVSRPRDRTWLRVSSATGSGCITKKRRER